VVSDRLLPGEHDVLIDGLPFHYVVRGRGALLVVQAPGWGIGSAYLRNGLAPLEKQFTVLTFDPRGSGSSAPMTHWFERVKRQRQDWWLRYL
jgi:pimeloyl-ACP methyl ester carboxylesterase